MTFREASGIQTGTLGVEHTLYSSTGTGYYQLQVDLSNMLNGDVVELRVKTPALSGGTSRTIFPATYASAPGSDGAMAISPPAPIVDAGDFTLKQVTGTAGRAFPWAVLRA